MENLIKIEHTSQGDVVSAKILYDFLEVDTVFPTWIKRMFDYGFEENKDFMPILEESTGGRPSIDYALTLDCAKEISMIQRSEKGKLARQYFIECEKKLKSSLFELPKTFSEALRLLADTKEREEKAVLELNTANQKILLDQPKVLFADTVTGSSNSILIRQFAKDLCDSGFDTGEKRLFEWFRTNGYLNRNNEPYQQYISMGLFEVVTRAFSSTYDTKTVKTNKVTGKGQVYFAKKIKMQNL